MDRAFNALNVVKITDADFHVTPMNKWVLSNSVPSRDHPVESTPRVEQSGSNIKVVTPSEACSLRTHGGSLINGRGDPNVEDACDSILAGKHDHPALP